MAQAIIRLPDVKRGYREKEAAEYIGMSSSFLRQGRMNGHRETRTPGPRWIKVGRTILYLKEDLDAWLDEHRASGGKRNAL